MQCFHFVKLQHNSDRICLHSVCFCITTNNNCYCTGTLTLAYTYTYSLLMCATDHSLLHKWITFALSLIREPRRAYLPCCILFYYMEYLPRTFLVLCSQSNWYFSFKNSQNVIRTDPFSANPISRKANVTSNIIPVYTCS